MATGDQYRRIELSDQLVFDSTGALIGARSGKSTSAEARFISAEQAVAIAAAFPSGSVGTLVEVTPYVQKTATGIVFSGACEYAGYDVVAVTASPTITIYDGTDTSGAVILPATTMTVGRFERTFKLQLLVGCYIVISGTATVNMLVG